MGQPVSPTPINDSKCAPKPMIRRGSVALRDGGATTQTVRSRSAERSQRQLDVNVQAELSESQRYLHRRAMSDPFDAVDDASHHGAEKHLSVANVLPTLPRFPIAETHNLNCWSEPPIEIFKVRGANYLKDKKKYPSAPYLFPARGVDVLLGDNAPKNVGSNDTIMGGKLRWAPTFLVNFRFPWGMLILYYEIPKKFTPFLRAKYGTEEAAPPPTDGFSPAEVAVCRFLTGDLDYKNSTLKLIPYVAEGPWVARNMVTGKPAIIGKKLPITYHYEPADPNRGLCEYLEADLDVGSSSATAKKIVSVCKRYMGCLTVDIGFVIQGNSGEELPEQMLGASRVHGADPLKAPTLVDDCVTDDESRDG